MPVRFSFLFYSCQKKNSWRYDIQGGRGNTLWEYNDNRNCFHGCTCLRTDATVHRYRPHSRRKNVCHRNSGRYAVLQSLCISVTNSLPYLMSILLVDFIAATSCPAVPRPVLPRIGTMGHFGTLGTISALTVLLFWNCQVKGR